MSNTQRSMQTSNTFPGDVTVLGMVRSAKIRLGSVKKAFPMYKKQFWVAREHSGNLEFYKNDQDPQAKGTISASQIKGVSFAGDKQNKFFDLCVQLRGGIERRFRLNSREERGRWYRILGAMATRHSTQSQWNGVMTAIQRRLSTASSGLSYRFDVELEGVSNGPSELLQYCVEAVDRGIEFAQSIAKTFAGASSAAPLTTPPTAPQDPAAARAEGGAATASVDAQQPGADGLVPVSSVPFSSVKLVIVRTPAETIALQERNKQRMGGTTVAGGVSNNSLAPSMEVDAAPPPPPPQPSVMDLELEMQRIANAGTRYDPSSKQMILAIVMYQDPSTGDVLFKHMHHQKVVSMLQSNVWRNPVIEGWLSQDPNTQAQLQQVVALMRGGEGTEDEALPATASVEHHALAAAGSGGGGRRGTIGGGCDDPVPSKFTVTMQWGHEMDGIDEMHLEEYLDQHVSYMLLAEILDTMRQLMREFPHEADPSLQHALPHAMQWRLPSAQECFRRYVVGVAVCLDRGLLEENVRPPLELLHRMWGDKTLNTATIVLARLRRREATLDESTFAHSICDQLRDLVLVVRLSHAFHAGDAHLSSVLGTRDGCTVNWESFVNAARSVGVEIPVAQLPSVALHFVQRYHTRVDRFVRSLRAARSQHTFDKAAAEGGGNAVGSFYENTFLPCVSTLSVDFVSRENQLLAPSPLPSIRSGIFSDVVVLVNQDQQQQSPEGVYHTPLDWEGDTAPPAVLMHPKFPIGFSYNIVGLSPWVRGYLSNPGNLVPAPDRNALPELDEDSSSSEEEALASDLGDAVASERKVETQVLNLQQVVNLVYDAQQGVAVPLKVGSGTIREAIDALERMFDQGPISKHILVRILIANLQRLRELYSAASRGQVPDGPFRPLTREAASGLLHAYCEYPQTEAHIDPTLETAEVLKRTHTRSALSEAIGRASSPAAATYSSRISPPTAISSSAAASPMERNRSRVVQMSETLTSDVSSDHNGPISFGATRSFGPQSGFDFETVATIALCALLPHEARMAMRCRRDILWLGLEDTGKTLLINSTRGVAQSTYPTIGLTESVIAFEEWIFGCKELGGRADFRKNWKQYMDRVDALHAVVFVVDAGKPSSFGEAAEYLSAISEASAFRHLPFLIVFNNYRVGERKSPRPETLYDAMKLERVRKRHPLQYCMCDATVVHSKLKVLPLDVQEGLRWICDVLAKECAVPPSHPKS